MSDDSGDSAERGQLRQEAAAWFARMRGPEAELHRAEFEQWLARGALHRGAYNRIAEIFSAGKHLKDNGSSRPKRRPLPFLTAAALVAVIAVAGITHVMTNAPTGGLRGGDTQLVSVIGQLRRVGLNDGSFVTLDSDSLVALHFDARTRLLRLERGRARFDVRHDQRPFIVVAGKTRVTARGTLFDVGFRTAGGVGVDLLRGMVEVAQGPDERHAPASPNPVLLHAGQTVTGRSDGTLSTPAPDTDRSNWTSRLLAFDRAPLSQVVAQANRYSVDKIVAGDPGIARLTVSGTFRVGDAARLAERLAALFVLDVDVRTPGLIVLRRRSPK